MALAEFLKMQRDGVREIGSSFNFIEAIKKIKQEGFSLVVLAGYAHLEKVGRSSTKSIYLQRVGDKLVASKATYNHFGKRKARVVRDLLSAIVTYAE